MHGGRRCSPCLPRLGLTRTTLIGKTSMQHHQASCDFPHESTICSPFATEIDVDQSLMAVYSCSPSRTPHSTSAYSCVHHYAQCYSQSPIVTSRIVLDRVCSRPCHRTMSRRRPRGARPCNGPRRRRQGSTPCGTSIPLLRMERLKYPCLSCCRRRGWSTRLVRC